MIVAETPWHEKEPSNSKTAGLALSRYPQLDCSLTSQRQLSKRLTTLGCKVGLAISVTMCVFTAQDHWEKLATGKRMSLETDVGQIGWK